MFESWLIRVRLVSLVGLKFGIVPGKTPEVIYGILLSKYFGIHI